MPAFDAGEFNLAVIQCFDIPLSEVFQQVSQGDKVVVLGRFGKLLVVAAAETVEPEAPLADELQVYLIDFQFCAGEIGEPLEIAVVIGDCRLGAVFFNFQIFQIIDDRLVVEHKPIL